MASYLHGEQIVEVIDVYDYKKTIFVILELMDGDITRLILERQGGLPEAFCKWTLYQTVKGLLTMHQRNILHRDIKSDNVLFKKDGSIKIADMGFSVFLSE